MFQCVVPFCFVFFFFFFTVGRKKQNEHALHVVLRPVIITVRKCEGLLQCSLAPMWTARFGCMDGHTLRSLPAVLVEIPQCRFSFFFFFFSVAMQAACHQGQDVRPPSYLGAGVPGEVRPASRPLRPPAPPRLQRGGKKVEHLDRGSSERRGHIIARITFYRALVLPCVQVSATSLVRI